jgi:hypothetical protein
LLGLAILVGVTAVFLWGGNPVDRVVAAAIERGGSRAVGTSVTVESVSMDLKAARGTLRGLHVANPDGFPKEDAVVLGTASVTLDPSGLTPEALRSGGPILIESLTFDDAVVLFQVDRKGVSNLDVLRRRLEESAGSAAVGGDEPRVIIRRIAVTGGGLTVDSQEVGGPRAERELPAFQLHDLGSPDGSPPGELGGIFLRALLEKSAKEAARGGVQDLIRDKVKGLLGGD